MFWTFFWFWSLLGCDNAIINCINKGFHLWHVCSQNPDWFFTTQTVLISRAYSKKGMRAVFQKKGTIFENLGKYVQNLKIFWKKSNLTCATIACMKQLEYILISSNSTLKTSKQSEICSKLKIKTPERRPTLLWSL